METFVKKASSGNVDIHRWASTTDIKLSCKQCFNKMILPEDNWVGIPQPVQYFCELHRHEGNKVDTDTIGAVSGKVIDGYGAEFKFGFQSQSSDNNTDLVLAVAKASNFNVNVQGRTNSFRTQYRLYCSVCHTDMDLGTRAITKAEIENPVTVTSKFCIEHAHRPNIKTPDTANYRKFREE